MSWCLLEIADHLALVETKTLESVQENISEVEAARPAGLKSKCKLWLLKRAMNGTFRFKVPVKAVLPRQDVSFQELKDAWKRFHSSWPGLIEQADPRWETRAIFKHPVGGWLSLPQTIEFLNIHMDHHLAQVGRTKLKLGLPQKQTK